VLLGEFLAVAVPWMIDIVVAGMGFVSIGHTSRVGEMM